MFRILFVKNMCNKNSLKSLIIAESLQGKKGKKEVCVCKKCGKRYAFDKKQKKQNGSIS